MCKNETHVAYVSDLPETFSCFLVDQTYTKINQNYQLKTLTGFGEKIPLHFQVSKVSRDGRKIP